ATQTPGPKISRLVGMPSLPRKWVNLIPAAAVALANWMALVSMGCALEPRTVSRVPRMAVSAMATAASSPARANTLLRRIRRLLLGLLELVRGLFLEHCFALGVFLAADTVVGDRELIVAGGIFWLKFDAGFQWWDSVGISTYRVQSEAQAQESVSKISIELGSAREMQDGFVPLFR